MTLERGVILGPKFSRSQSGDSESITIETHADPALLRHALLYFDKIHWAQNAYMKGGLPQEIVYLHDAGIADARITIVGEEGPGLFDEPWHETLRRGGSYPFPMPTDMPAAFFKAQAETFLALDRAEPEVWSMGGHAPMWEAPASIADRRTVAEIKINACLPTPPNDVHIVDVLEFRERYKREFNEFRRAIDEIHASIESSSSPLRAESTAIERLNTAIEEVRAVAEGTWIDRVRSAVKIDRVLSATTIAKIAGAYTLSQALPVGTPLIGRLVPFALVADKVSIDFKELFAPQGLSDCNKSYAYLLKVTSTFGM